MKNILFTCILLILAIMVSVVFTSCEPEYIHEEESRVYTVIDRETSTQLDPATEFFFGIKTTEQEYVLILKRDSSIKSIRVSRDEYYNHPIGSKYNMKVMVKKHNPKYKKKG